MTRISKGQLTRISLKVFLKSTNKDSLWAITPGHCNEDKNHYVYQNKKLALDKGFNQHFNFANHPVSFKSLKRDSEYNLFEIIGKG